MSCDCSKLIFILVILAVVCVVIAGFSGTWPFSEKEAGADNLLGTPTVDVDPPKDLITSSAVKHILEKSTVLKVTYVASWNITGATSTDLKSKWSTHFKDLKDSGYNVIIIAFVTSTGLGDESWVKMDRGHKLELVQYIHDNDMVLLGSIGGATEKPSNMCTFEWVGQTVAEHCYQNLYDGVDLDFEGIAPPNASTKSNQPICTDIMLGYARAIREQYGKHNIRCIVTSAPQPPYFGGYWLWDYGQMEEKDPNAFDFYNVQFYNNGQDASWEQNFSSTDDFKAEGALLEPVINAAYMVFKAKIPKHKLVAGKMGRKGVGDGNDLCQSDGSYVDSQQWIEWVNKAKLRGIMYWAYSARESGSTQYCDPDAQVWLPPPV